MAKPISRKDFVEARDSRVICYVRRYLGAAIFGPPKMLGYDSSIWVGGRITGDSSDDITSLRTALYHNLIRRKAANFVMALCVPLALVLAYLGLRSNSFIGAVQALGPVAAQYLPLPEPSAEQQVILLTRNTFSSMAGPQRDVAGACRAMSDYLAANQSTGKLSPAQQAAMKQVLDEHHCVKH